MPSVRLLLKFCTILYENNSFDRFATNFIWLFRLLDFPCPAISTVVSLSRLWNRKVLIFFLLFLRLFATAVLFVIFEHSYINYKSEMQTITPAIKTPKAEGQGQYGTARWMEKDEIPDAFTMVQIDRNDPLIRRLMDEGRADLFL